MSSVGRPREHDEATRIALRDAAERLMTEGGIDAVSVRALAREVGATTRAIYSLFGSKEGLLVDALATKAFEILERGLRRVRETDDVVSDLVDVGVLVFRRFVVRHPTLFRVTFQRLVPGMQAGPELTAARSRTLARLEAKVRRVKDAGRLGTTTVSSAVLQFNALCEGLGNAELREGKLPILPAGQEEQAWREALTTLIRGWAPDRLTSETMQ
jgi:AcrR family transcriptional regulator